MAESPIKVRIIRPHDVLPDSDYSDYHEWIDIPPTGLSATLWRDARGYNRRGSYRWTAWRCNNPDCLGEIIVRLDTIEDLVNALGGTDG